MNEWKVKGLEGQTLEGQRCACARSEGTRLELGSPFTHTERSQDLPYFNCIQNISKHYLCHSKLILKNLKSKERRFLGQVPLPPPRRHCPPAASPSSQSLLPSNHRHTGNLAAIPTELFPKQHEERSCFASSSRGPVIPQAVGLHPRGGDVGEGKWGEGRAACWVGGAHSLKGL